MGHPQRAILLLTEDFRCTRRGPTGSDHQLIENRGALIREHESGEVKKKGIRKFSQERSVPPDLPANERPGLNTGVLALVVRVVLWTRPYIDGH
jgi:hypothetical protein